MYIYTHTEYTLHQNNTLHVTQGKMIMLKLPSLPLLSLPPFLPSSLPPFLSFLFLPPSLPPSLPPLTLLFSLGNININVSAKLPCRLCVTFNQTFHNVQYIYVHIKVTVLHQIYDKVNRPQTVSDS